MTDASVNDPCECGQTTIRGCADMPSRHCGAWDKNTPAFTAHELSALAEQGMTLTEAEEANVADIVADLRKAGNDDEACGGTLDLWPCRFGEEIIKAAAVIVRLRADNARLREALAPFAEAAMRPEYQELGVTDTWFGPSMRLGDFRRARKAMEASNGNQ